MQHVLLCLSMMTSWLRIELWVVMQESSGEFMLAFPHVKQAVYFCLEVCTSPVIGFILKHCVRLYALRQDLLIWAPVIW